MRSAAALLLLALLLPLPLPRPAQAAYFPPGRILFSPGQDLETEVASFIGTAIRHAFIFSERIESDMILEQMVRTRNMTAVPVRLVTPVDGMTAARFQRLADGRVEVKTAGGSAGLSGTWILVDGTRVLHTPASLTYAHLRTDRNHTIVLDHHLLAENYLNEFNEMFLTNEYGSGSPAGLAYPKIEVAPAAIETYFTPENDPGVRVGALVDLARSSVRLTCRAFGSATLAAKFKAKHGEGVAVSVIHDEAATSATSAVHEDLKRAGVDLWRKEYSLDLARIRENVLVVDDRHVVLLPPSLPAGEALSRDGASSVIDSTATSAWFADRHDRLVERILGGVNLRGQVRDRATGEPLFEAKLTVLGQTTVAWTDRYGLYSFKNLPTGEVTLEVEKAGYYTVERRLAIPGGRVDFEVSGIADSGALRGAVADTVTRRPLENIVLAARYIDPGTGVRTVVRTRSGAGGGFRFDKLPVGQAAVVAETTEWIPNEPAAAVVRRAGTVDLTSTIFLRPRFAITAMPNPVYPATVFINVKSYAALGRIPEVVVTQKDYVPVPVPMQRTVSDTREVELFVGSYRIAHGYFGTVAIDVNRGEAAGSFELGFLEAGTRYTFRAPGNARFDLVETGGASGAVAAFAATFAHGNPELLPEVAGGVDLSLPRGARLSAESAITLPSPGDGALVFRAEGGTLVPVETAAREGELVGRATEAGRYFALRDRVAPSIRLDGAAVVVTDLGSGIAPFSLRLAAGGSTVETVLRGVAGGYRATLAGVAEGDELSVEVADRAGNVARLAGRAAAAPAAVWSLEVAPNPVRGDRLVARLRLPAAGTARVAIHDAAGRKVHEARFDSPSVLHPFEWDLRDRRGRAAGNGVYFLVARDGATGAVRARAKAALLR